MKRLALYTLSAVLMLAGEPAVGSTHLAPPAPRGVGYLLLAPFGLMASMTSSWFRTPSPLDNSALLVKRGGWGVRLVRPTEVYPSVPIGTDP